MIGAPVEQDEHDTTEHDAFLCSYLSDRDEECPMCSYNLRGLTGQVCPECGEALRIRVSLCEPKMGLYLAGVVGWAAGFGFSGFVLGYMVWMTMLSRYGSHSGTGVVLIEFILHGGMLGFSLWKGRWIRRRSDQLRVFLLVIAWVSSFVLSIAFFVVV